MKLGLDQANFLGTVTVLAVACVTANRFGFNRVTILVVVLSRTVLLNGRAIA